MRADPRYSEDFVSERMQEGGEFNMAESSVCVGTVAYLYEGS